MNILVTASHLFSHFSQWIIFPEQGEGRGGGLPNGNGQVAIWRFKKFPTRLGQLSIRLYINPLSPNSDKLLISPYIVTT